jgi:hypothetical protein
MGKLLSRISLAATAKAWGLQQYLQLSVPSEQPPATSRALTATSRSSSVHTIGPHRLGTTPRPSTAAPLEAEGSLEQALRRRAGRSAFWSSDELGEMFEGVVGALLLDSSYARVEQLLRPWVASSYAAEVAEHQASSTAGGDHIQLPGVVAAGGNSVQQQQQQQQELQEPSMQPSGALQACDTPTVPNTSSGQAQVQHETALLLLLERIRAERRYWVEALRSALQRHQQQYRATQEGRRLAQQIARQMAAGLHQQCGGCRLSPAQLQQAGWLLLEQLELRPSEEGQRLQYLGHALLRLCVAVHVFEEGQAVGIATSPASPAAAAAALAGVSGLQTSIQRGSSAWRGMHAVAVAAGGTEDCQLDKEQQQEQQEQLAHADRLFNSICPLESTPGRKHSRGSSSRRGSEVSLPLVPTDAISSDEDSCSTSSSSSSSSSSGGHVSLVQQLNKRFMCLHSMRFR